VSIVEKALRKAQATAGLGARVHEHRDPPTVVGRVVEMPAGSDPIGDLPATRSGRVVHIDWAALREASILPPEDHERAIADQYRAIKRPLLRNAAEAMAAGSAVGNVIMTASALPGDGKTFTCVNLALSLARERDYTVLLVDSDTPKPHVSKLFGVDSEPGLLDVLMDPARTIESVILPTDVPRLSLLPVGRGGEPATELLASARMSEVVNRLARLYSRGIVIFDSPPLLLTSEAAALAMQMGQVALVVKAGETPQHAVLHAIEVLANCKKVSLILNQVDVAPLESYYYGYPYGSSYGQSRPTSGSGSADGLRQ